MTEVHQTPEQIELLKMTSTIVAAHVGNAATQPEDITALIDTVFSKLAGISMPSAKAAERPKPAVPICESVTDDHLICLEDGRKMKMLKRHIGSVFNLTPDQYREKWGLPDHYPMVAPNYALKRQELAKKIGLGHHKKTKAS
ncbi:MAG: MucR family transcriptional regulator [Rhodobacteraceae bacterium]|nr:MucR family transcriptional regulator [Paracoccaceae bacterium]